MLPPASSPAAALTAFCCACSFVIFSLIFRGLKTLNRHTLKVAVFLFFKIVAVRSGKDILSLGSKIESFTSAS